jgi:putative transcriptional regulator
MEQNDEVDARPHLAHHSTQCYSGCVKRPLKTIGKNRAPDRVFADLAEDAMDLKQLGLIDQHALARIKSLCVDEPPTYSPSRVMTIRTRKARMSQSVFAKLLNVSISTVQKWEAPAADRHPSGAAAKLLQIIEKKGIDALI